MTSAAELSGGGTCSCAQRVAARRETASNIGRRIKRLQGKNALSQCTLRRDSGLRQTLYAGVRKRPDAQSESAARDAVQLGAGQCDRIALHAAGFGGLGGDLRNRVFGDAIASERRDGETAAEISDPDDSVAGGGVRLASKQTRDLGVARERGAARVAGSQGFDVGFDSVGKN